MGTVYGYRHPLAFILIFVGCVLPVFSGEITISGKYLGRNLFIRNPLNTETGSFCIQEIYLNGNRLPDLPRSSALQIDLSKLTLYDAVEVRVVHYDTCLPEFINPDAVQQESEFQFLYSQIDDNSINWITTGEVPGGVFLIEKFKYRGWQRIDSVEAKGQMDNNQYSVTSHHYSGNNDYRLTYRSVDGREVVGEEITFYSILQQITISPPVEVIDWISLSRETDYEIYDENDRLVIKGFGDYVSVEHLDYGTYFIVIENEPLRIYKPEPEIIPRPKRKRKKNK